MDPDEALDGLRVLLAASDDMDPAEALAEVRELFEGLDDWLSKAGMLPRDWQRTK